ncbi:hypothetical protein [Roseivivax sp. CAU 1761]
MTILQVRPLQILEIQDAILENESMQGDLLANGTRKIVVAQVGTGLLAQVEKDVVPGRKLPGRRVWGDPKLDVALAILDLYVIV